MRERGGIPGIRTVRLLLFCSAAPSCAEGHPGRVHGARVRYFVMFGTKRADEEEKVHYEDSVTEPTAGPKGYRRKKKSEIFFILFFPFFFFPSSRPGGCREQGTAHLGKGNLAS